MSVMRGSGVYVTEVDESFASFDTTNLTFMVPMRTMKGVPGKLNPVTISNYKEVLGYDLDFNNSYLGLAQLLSSCSVVQVLRTNLNPTYGNVAIFKDGTFFQTSGTTDVDALHAAVCLRQKACVLPGTAAPAGLSQTTQLAESVKKLSCNIVVAGVTWATDNGTDGDFVWIVGKTTAAAGSVNYATGEVSVTFCTGTPTDTAYDIEYVHDSGLAVIVSAKTPGSWSDLSVRLSRYFETLENVATTGTLSFSLGKKLQNAEGSYKVLNMAGAVLGTSGVPNGSSVATITSDPATGLTGTVDVNTGAVSLTFNPTNFPAAGFPILLQHKYILDDPYFLLEVLQKTMVGENASYTELESARVSFVNTLEDFIDTLTFTYINAHYVSALTATDVGDVTPLDLLYGTDGTEPSSTDYDFSKVDQSAFSMICMNGEFLPSVVSAFIAYFEPFNKKVLFDIPNYPTAVAAKNYADSVMASMVAQAYWVGDLRMVGTKQYCIYPSVKAALAYSKMFKATGYLNYPPAGYDYGAVAAETLVVTDASINAAFLKQNKINYIIAKSAGPVIWEQRTRYAYESDLSYASTVSTYFALAARMSAFADNFPFRLVTAELLVMLKVGLDAVATDYLQRGFVWGCEVLIPSFAQVKASGARFLDIKVNVKFAEDGEEFTFNFHIKATA